MIGSNIMSVDSTSCVYCIAISQCFNCAHNHHTYHHLAPLQQAHLRWIQYSVVSDALPQPQSHPADLPSYRLVYAYWFAEM